jgi:hypothetical protein
MFSGNRSPEDLRQEAALQRRLAVILKDRVVAATMRAAADEMDRQADLLEARAPQRAAAGRG